MTFKPLLASPVEFNHLDYTNLWMSPKLDGIRALVIDGVVVSRNLKPIPNASVQRRFAHLEGWDGELIVGDPTAKDCYRETNSGVMSKDGEPDVTFHAFDRIDMPGVEYWKRYESLRSGAHVEKVQQLPCESHAELLDHEDWLLHQGYEGVMLRAFRGPRSFYKYGRSTAKETTLLKLKRFSDRECTVIGFQELLKNGNEATKDALGHTVRSAHQDNMIPMGTLGALICRTDDGIEFNIGTGFDQAARAHIWANRDNLLGGLAKFRSFDVGVKSAPRFPVFVGFRDPIDT